MLIKRAIDNCDGKGLQIVEIEVPDLAPVEIAARKAKREERLATRSQQKP
jgi:hypothetical protein